MSVFLKICIGYFALMWIGFGIMHFTHHDMTMNQIPKIFPMKSAIVYVTGIAEVVVGLLIFSKRSRKLAALASLILLVLLFPAMVKIMIEGSGEHGFIPIILVPGNLLLAYCSWILWKNSDRAMAIN